MKTAETAMIHRSDQTTQECGWCTWRRAITQAGPRRDGLRKKRWQALRVWTEMMLFTISWFLLLQIKPLQPHWGSQFAAALGCGKLKETRNRQRNLQTAVCSQAQCDRCHNKFSDDETFFFLFFRQKREKRVKFPQRPRPVSSQRSQFVITDGKRQTNPGDTATMRRPSEAGLLQCKTSLNRGALLHTWPSEGNYICFHYRNAPQRCHLWSHMCV